jgi:hypothetical protein
MSWYAKVPSEILSNKDLSSSGKLLVGVIISLSNKTGYCFASNQYISDILGVSLAYTRALIKELESKNIIIRKMSDKKSNDNSTRMMRLVDLKLTNTLSDGNVGDTIVSGGVIAEYQGGDTIVAGGVIAGYHHNKEINIKVNKKVNNVSDRFDEFWELYEKKVGKEKAKSKWIKLKENEKEKCLLSIPSYKIARPNPVYRKDPERYLSNKVWEDEIPNGVVSTTLNTNQTTASSEAFEIKIPDRW